MEFNWEAPLKRFCAHKGGANDVCGLWARQTSPSMGLVEFSAKHGFFALGKTALLTLSRLLGCEVDPAGTVLQRCQRLVEHVLDEPWVGCESHFRARATMSETFGLCCWGRRSASMGLGALVTRYCVDGQGASASGCYSC